MVSEPLFWMEAVILLEDVEALEPGLQETVKRSRNENKTIPFIGFNYSRNI